MAAKAGEVVKSSAVYLSGVVQADSLVLLSRHFAKRQTVMWQQKKAMSERNVDLNNANKRSKSASFVNSTEDFIVSFSRNMYL